MKKLGLGFACAALTILSGFGTDALASGTNSGEFSERMETERRIPSKPQTFEDWCLASQAGSLTPEQSDTVQKMVEYALNGRSDQSECQRAQGFYDRMTALGGLFTFAGLGITNVEPIASLTEAQVINLDNNEIKDLRPLRWLRKLVYISISNNKPARITCPFFDQSMCVFN